MKPKQSLKKRILFALAATIVFFSLVEIEMHFLDRIRPDWLQINVADQDTIILPIHQKLIFGLNPGKQFQAGKTYRINSLGWRGTELPEEKEPGLYRMMFVGDSSVWGDSVSEPEAFAWYSASLLQDELGHPVDVVNAATPGYSSTQSRIIFEDYVDRVRPDVLVIATIWSDIIVRPFTDTEMLRRFSSEGYRFESDFRLLLRKSATFRFLESRIISARGIPKNRRLALSTIINSNVQPTSTGTPRVPVPQHLQNLRAMAEECRKRNILVCLLILPIDDRRFSWPKERLKDYQQNFHTVASEFDGLLVDAYTAFPKDPKLRAALFFDGIHPNVEGHMMIAKQLAAAMAKRLKSVNKQ